MAIFRASPIVAAISGNLGGVTFVQSNRGPVVRHRPVSKPKASKLRLQQSEAMRTSYNNWRSLTDQQRASWRQAAQSTNRSNRLGVSAPVSGFNLFVAYDRSSKFWQQGPIQEFQRDPAPPQVLTVTTNFTVGFQYNVAITNTSPSTSSALQIWGTPYFSTTTRKFIGPLKFIRQHTSIFSTMTQLNIRPFWNTIWQELDVGQAFAVHVTMRSLSLNVLPTPPISAQGIAVS